MTTQVKNKLMIMAAGTGGHIFPGIAIAQEMRARGWEVSWLGTAHGMERDIVPKHGIAMDSIDFAGLRGKGLGHTVTGAFKMLGAFAACRKFIAARQPDVVLGMGGYVTVPGGMMARARRAAGAGECRCRAAAVEQDPDAAGAARAVRLSRGFRQSRR
jgi:UDP-N-acetylglucosamine--N-acetylmuramyl-(pentapeptide) pyrophosphoryl-undecaprenol N-acetylglucosamine transferase